MNVNQRFNSKRVRKMQNLDSQCLHLVANRGPTDCNPTLTSEKIIKRSKSDDLVMSCKYSGFNG